MPKKIFLKLDLKLQSSGRSYDCSTISEKMKNIIFSSTLSFIFFGCISNINHDDIGLVPQPTNIERVSGKTILDDDWTIKHNGDHIDLNTLKNILTEDLNKDHKVKLNDDADKVI